jgi:hypothetical protein
MTFNAKHKAQAMKQQRKKRFIDSRLQGRLILLMVALEIIILATAMFYLNFRFAGLIEHDLYSIHRISQDDMLSAFAEQIGWVVFEMGILNAMMLFIAHYIWSRQISSVVQVFRNDLYHIRSLQFIELEHINKPVHELLTLLDLWYSKERKRIASLKEVVEQVNIQAHYQDNELQTVRDQINRCAHLLESKQAH